MGTKIVRSALLLHVLCSLYPFRWLFRKDDDGSAASMILHNTSAAETSILLKHFAQDFGVIYGYLAYAAITSPSTYAVNRLCLAFSVLNVLLLVVTHNYFHPTPTIQEYDARFFREMLVWNGIGILVLILIPGPIQRKEFPARKMKWSIPANAIFCGAVRWNIRYNWFLTMIGRYLNCSLPLPPCNGMPTGIPSPVTCAFGC